MHILNKATLKNLHLLASLLLIIPIALAYGLYPKYTMLMLLSIRVDTINLSNVFRAIMGLYLGLSCIWIMGIIKPKFWTTATITNIAFMGGLAFGRLLSLAVDGLPSIYFLIGLFLELLFAIWGVRNLMKY